MLPHFTLKLFLRTRRLLGAYLATVGILFTFLFYKLSIVATTGAASRINHSMDVGTALFIALAFLSFEFLSLTKREQLDEAVCYYPKQNQFRLCQSTLLLVLATLLAVEHFGFSVAACQIDDCLRFDVLAHIALSTVLNIWLVMVVGLLFGAVLARFCIPVVAYCLIFLAAFLQTSYSEVIFRLLSLPFGQAGYMLRDFTRLVAQNTNAVMDCIYGYAIEASRWNAALFWVCAFGALWGWFAFRLTQKKKVQRAVCGVLALFAVFHLGSFALSGEDSIVRKDYREDVLEEDDYLYYSESYHPERVAELREEDASFQVLAYDIDLTVNRKLEATVTMTLSGEPKDGCYSFTLYHKYTVSSVTDGDGNKLSFTRETDYLDVQTDKALTELTVRYSGSGYKYFSNAQGIALPGYFPYYPFAGCYSLWDFGVEEYRNGLRVMNDGVKVNTDLPTAFFTVTLHSGLTVMSNLEEVSDHVYQGEAQTVSLIGGLIEKTTSDGIQCNSAVFSKKGSANRTPNLGMVEGKIREYRAALGLDPELPEDFKILLVPDTVRYLTVNGNDSEKFVFFEDHLLVQNYDSEQICEWLDGLIAEATGEDTAEDADAEEEVS